MTLSVTIQKKYSTACRKNSILEQFIDVTDILHHSPFVSSIRVIEQTAIRVRSEWFASFGNAPFSWIQIDTLDRERMKVRSEAISGDFTSFTMLWDISGTSDGATDIVCSLECSLDNALVEKNCGAVIQSDLQEFIETIISLRVRNAVEQTVEDRVFGRVGMNCSIGMMVNGQLLDTVVIDVSRGGVRFSPVNGQPVPGRGNLLQWESCGISAKIGILRDESTGICRGTFLPPLDEQQFRKLLMQWSGGRNGSGETVAFYDVIHAPASTGIRINARPHH